MSKLKTCPETTQIRSHIGKTIQMPTLKKKKSAFQPEPYEMAAIRANINLPFL